MPRDHLNSIDKHVGGRIRARRSKLAMSRIEMAEALGVTLQQVLRYEKGRTSVAAGRLHQLSQILGVPAAYFFAGLHGGPETADASVCHQRREFVEKSPI